MAPRIFATGVTGYVGGDILHHLLKAHPSLEPTITCLVRSPNRGKALSTIYPGLKIVYGTLDDSSILEAEVAKADIVLHFASCDHPASALAIKRGFEKGNGGIWIHTSGTDILLPPGEKGGLEGEKKVYDDWDGVGECFALPESNSHGPMEEIVRSSFSSKVKGAIICPPTIWGVGRGTGNTRSHQIYHLASLTLSRGAGIKLPSPEADKLFWPNIHIYDLSNLFLQVIEDAISEVEGKRGKSTWNEEGYYFAENGRHYWQEVAGWISKEAARQGFIKSGEVRELNEGDREELKSVGPALWNLISDCKSIRARKLFGWTPKEGDLKEEIQNIVRSEAERLGLKN